MDKIFSPTKERLVEYLNLQGFSKEYFFKKTSISASNFKGNGLKSELGGDKIAKILTEFPDISPEWLLTGKGSMLRAIGGQQINTNNGNGNISAINSSHINVKDDNLSLRIVKLEAENKSLKDTIKHLKEILIAKK